jgi:hypothetical protein
MERLTFSIDIAATANMVFDRMLGLTDKGTYQRWTAEFNPTSTYEGRWTKGGKMHFVGTDEHGNRGGMVSEIADLVPDSFVSIRHLGMLKGKEEVLTGAEVEPWAGGLENYTLTQKGNTTTVLVEIDAVADFIGYFNATWPNALLRLKELCEK